MQSSTGMWNSTDWYFRAGEIPETSKEWPNAIIVGRSLSTLSAFMYTCTCM